MQTLTLEPHEITTILRALAKLPYEDVVGLMTKITYQASVTRKEESNENQQTASQLWAEYQKDVST